MSEKTKSSIKKLDYLKLVEEEGNWRVWKHKGIWCVINRMPDGFLCGYIGLPDKVNIQSQSYNHPWMGYCDNLDMHANVHGGITYGPETTKNGTVFFSGINEELTWIGFDCNHSSDYPAREDGEYKTMEFVIKECENVITDYYKSLHSMLSEHLEAFAAESH